MQPINEIKELYRQRVDLHNAEKKLTNQIKAVCRRLTNEGPDKSPLADKLYDAMLGNGTHPLAPTAYAHCLPLIGARQTINESRLDIEKHLVRLSKQLDAAPWVDRVKGVSFLTLAAIVGEAGDLSDYAGPAKLWKRMGLAVVSGERQRRVAGNPELAKEHAYSARRRSVIWNMGECIVKAQVRRDKETDETHAIGPYGQFYLYERERQRNIVETHGHANNRAKRHMTKRVLRDLWRAWQSVEHCGSIKFLRIPRTSVGDRNSAHILGPCCTGPRQDVGAALKEARERQEQT